VEAYDFVAELQRLHALAGFVRNVRLDQIMAHLNEAEKVAPIFEPAILGQGSQRIAVLRRFIAKALEFQRECELIGVALADAERAVSVRQLPPTASQPQATQ